MAAPRIDTERLVLRAFTRADFGAYAAVWADPDVVRYISGKPSSERAAHLADVALPMLFLQGTRDALASMIRRPGDGLPRDARRPVGPGQIGVYRADIEPGPVLAEDIGVPADIRSRPDRRHDPDASFVSAI